MTYRTTPPPPSHLKSCPENDILVKEVKRCRPGATVVVNKTPSRAHDDTPLNNISRFISTITEICDVFNYFSLMRPWISVLNIFQTILRRLMALPILSISIIITQVLPKSEKIYKLCILFHCSARQIHRETYANNGPPKSPGIDNIPGKIAAYRGFRYLSSCIPISKALF